MKEYLLHDIMELNDNRDPILMEKLFEVLRLCLSQLVLNYGEAYMTETNSYWKTKYPKLVKKGTPTQMAGNPVNIAGVNKNGQRVAQGNQTYGKELTEEELLKSTIRINN
jgi:hypothetical protein